MTIDRGGLIRRRRLPAYGRALDDARRQGMVPVLPAGAMLVCLGWRVHREIADRHPRVVVDPDTSLGEYDFRPLAGLPVLIVFDRAHEALLDVLGDAILAAHPSDLAAAPLDGGDDWTTWEVE